MPILKTINRCNKHLLLKSQLKVLWKKVIVLSSIHYSVPLMHVSWLCQSGYINCLLLCNQVFLLVHTCEVKLKGVQRKREIQNGVVQSDTKELCSDPEIHSDNGGLPSLSPDGQNASGANLHSDDYGKKDDLGIEGSNVMEDKFMEKAPAGALWDVFRREDTPKLVEYINMHREDFENADNIINDYVS